MGLLRSVAKWNDRRYKLIQLRHELDEAERRFKIDTADMRKHSDAYESSYSEYRADVDVTLAEIGAIETLRSLEKAWYWGAAVPQHPMLPDLDNEYWSWNKVLGGFQLTPKGLREIRHAVSAERDMFHRPIVSIAAIVISVISLLVSMFK